MTPSPLTLLVSFSFLASTAALVIGALVLYVSRALWILPGTFILTITYHVLISLLARTGSHPNRSTRRRRIESIFTVGAAYTLTICWTAALAIALTLTILISINKYDIPPQNIPPNASRRPHTPLLISACGIALLEACAMGAIALLSHKERRKAQYQAKWQWKITLNTSSKWSITKDTKDGSPLV